MQKHAKMNRILGSAYLKKPVKQDDPVELILCIPLPDNERKRGGRELGITTRVRDV